MCSRILPSTFVALSFLTTTASAALYVTPNNAIFNALMNSTGCTSYVETFDSIPTGFFASGYSSSTGPVHWTAVATGDLFVDNGFFSTNMAGQMLTFNFNAPGLNIRAVGGNFFAADSDFTPMPAIVVVELDDGTSYVNLTTFDQSFVGFVSTTAAISSISLSLPISTNLFATVDSIIFGVVPAPGALGLFALAGFAARRRRA